MIDADQMIKRDLNGLSSQIRNIDLNFVKTTSFLKKYRVFKKLMPSCQEQMFAVF